MVRVDLVNIVPPMVGDWFLYLVSRALVEWNAIACISISWLPNEIGFWFVSVLVEG